MEVRFLTSADIELFDNFLARCLKLDTLSQSEKDAWEWYRSLLEQDKKGFFLNALIIDGQIDFAACFFAIDVLYNVKKRRFPFWVCGLMRTVTFSNNPPVDKINLLTNPVSDIFERNGYKTFYIIRNVPNRIGYHNIEEYIKRVQNKTYQNLKYNVLLDRFVEDPLDDNQFDMIKNIVPKSIPRGKKIAVFRYELKYEFNI